MVLELIGADGSGNKFMSAYCSVCSMYDGRQLRSTDKR